MSQYGWKGHDALEAKDYAGAIDLLTKALEETQSPVFLIDRSTAYQRTNQHELALADADNAVLAAVKRAKRELIGKAHFRRALALYGLKRYGDSRKCLNWSQKINEKEKGLTNWISIVKNAYDAAGGDDAEANQITVKEIPDAVEDIRASKSNTKVDKGKGKEKEEPAESKVAPAPVPVNAPPKATPKEKIRHDWYQSQSSVTIDLLASGIAKDKVEVVFEERTLEISFPVADSTSTYDFTLSPLFSSIDTSKSSYRVTPRKIEITLSKKVQAKWGALEWVSNALEPSPPDLKSSAPASDPIPSHILDPGKKVVEPAAAAKGPSYPTSSRNGPKNWDSIGNDDDEEEDANPDDFFKKLYANSDDDTKKAMMKSMQESGGTSLSTSWSDVRSKTFKVDPPAGMEAKKWEI